MTTEEIKILHEMDVSFCNVINEELAMFRQRQEAEHRKLASKSKGKRGKR